MFALQYNFSSIYPWCSVCTSVILGGTEEINEDDSGYYVFTFF